MQWQCLIGFLNYVDLSIFFLALKKAPLCLDFTVLNKVCAA